MPRLSGRVRPFQTPILIPLALLLVLWTMRRAGHATEPRRVPSSELAADVRARHILTARREALEALAHELLVKETLTRAEVDEVIKRTSAPRLQASAS